MPSRERNLILLAAAELAVRFRDVELFTATLALGLDPWVRDCSVSIAQSVVRSNWVEGQILIAVNWKRGLTS